MSERRTGWLLVVLLVGQLVLLAVQVPAGGTGDTLLERFTLRLLAPVSGVVTSTVGWARGAAQGLGERRKLLRENGELRRRVEELRLELLRLRDVQFERDLLSAAVGYAVPPDHRLRVADVVYADYSSWLRTLILYTGDRALFTDQPVLATEGLVGRVIVIARPYAKVQLITDRAATVGVMVERTRRQGLVRGGAGGELELDYVPLQADVRVGDRIVTSGIDGIYPREIPVGKVVSVEPGNELFHHIVVEPVVDFGSLNQVYVLEREPLPDEIKETLSGADR